ncbi:fused MFS/spermidine synthase [Candidatus Woesebacteria bacterium]|nr:fused MFS/spermidine synthase [Candidatus Woesebacteria bacterium]QQG47903.1 MAG: fused MFS/spermidine synthase [Candidatus Woesebacteria bacterium]
MSKLLNFLTGTKILDEKTSIHNGKLTVVKDFTFGTYIKGGGLTQSGGVAKDVWSSSLKKVKSKNIKIKKALILGLGGGSIAQIIKRLWPSAKITGIDIDPIIVEFGKKYMGLDKLNVEIHIQDALSFIETKSLPEYDLICVDTYQGDIFPEKFENLDFLKNITKILSKNGVIVFNRLYYGEKRPQAMKFLISLEKVFPKVEVVHPEANIMFICKV